MADETDFQLQNSAQAIEYGREAIKTAVTLNGGAAVAIVGFVGGSSNVPNPGGLQDALWWLCLGLVWAFCAMAVGYVAQTFFAINNYNRHSGLRSDDNRGPLVSILGILFVVGSVGCFLVGIYDASQALFSAPPTP